MDCDTNIKDLGSLKIIEIATKSELFTAIYKNHKIKNNVFVDDLENYKSNNNYKNHYIFGDINIDILEKNSIKNKFNSNIDDYINNYYQNGYLSVINNVTRPNYNENGGTCIDHIFVKADFNHKNFKSAIYKSTFSDHYSTFLSIGNCSTQNHTHLKKSINYNKLLSLACNENWNDIINIKDADSALEAILTTISTLIKKSEFKVKHQNKKRKPWITNGLVKSCNTKLRLNKNWKNDPNNKDKEEKYKNYCRYLLLK